MGWLGRLRRPARDPDDLAPGEGISLSRREAVEIGDVRDLYGLLEALAEALPGDAVLYVEGTSFAPDVEEFLRERSAESDTKVTSGTAWPAPSSFHVPATPENLRAFHELALRHAEPEVCTHLVAYRAGQVLVSAYDAGDGTVFVHEGLGPSAIARLRDAAS